MSDALGPTEVARVLGVSRQALHLWRQAGTFPEPDVKIGGHVGWYFETVERERVLRAEGRT